MQSLSCCTKWENNKVILLNRVFRKKSLLDQLIWLVAHRRETGFSKYLVLVNQRSTVSGCSNEFFSFLFKLEEKKFCKNYQFLTDDFLLIFDCRIKVLKLLWSRKYPGLHNDSHISSLKVMSSVSSSNFSFFPSLVKTGLQVVHLQRLASVLKRFIRYVSKSPLTVTFQSINYLHLVSHKHF